jgi:hypothetical protein
MNREEFFAKLALLDERLDAHMWPVQMSTS